MVLDRSYLNVGLQHFEIYPQGFYHPNFIRVLRLVCSILSGNLVSVCSSLSFRLSPILEISQLLFVVCSRVCVTMVYLLNRTKRQRLLQMGVTILQVAVQ